MTTYTASTTAAEVPEAIQFVHFVTSAPLGWEDEEARLRERWRPCLDALRSWLNSPDDLADDYVEAPSEQAIESAFLIANWMIDQGNPAPLRTVPTVDGGVAFEHRSDAQIWRTEIGPDGAAEVIVFVDARLIERGVVDLAAIKAELTATP